MTIDQLSKMSEETSNEAKENMKKFNPGTYCRIDEYTREQKDTLNLLENIDKTISQQPNNSITKSGTVLVDVKYNVLTTYNEYSGVWLKILNETDEIFKPEIWVIQEGKSTPMESYVNYNVDNLETFEDIYPDSFIEGYAYFENVNLNEDYQINVKDRSCYEDCMIIKIDGDR